MAVNGCPTCLEKQRRIDALEDEMKRLRAALAREQRKAQEGFFAETRRTQRRKREEHERIMLFYRCLT